MYFRNRRRSSVNLNSLNEETIKSRLPFDDYLGHGEYHDESKKDVELEMLTMLSVNQDNGEWILCVPFIDRKFAAKENEVVRNNELQMIFPLKLIQH